MTDKEIIGNLYSENLELKSKLSTHEIDDIFRPQLSDEGVIAKALKLLGFNWVARDRDKKLYVYRSKPTRHELRHEYSSEWDDIEDTCMPILNMFDIKSIQTYFSGVAWEDEEPTSLDDLLSKGAY